VETPEDAEIYMPMTSRLVQLTMIDVLAIGVTLRRGTDFIKHLKKIKDSAMKQRYPLIRNEQEEE
jgi:RpiR family carbohydrate utilization transcriptional regulator